MGYFNAKVGEDKGPEHGIVAYGLGERNDNGDRLSEFCKANNLIVENCFTGCFKSSI